MLNQTATPQNKLEVEGLYDHLSFEVGALARDALEGLATDLGLYYDKHTSSDDLRSSVLRKLEQQGEPCVRFEYDPTYTGGEYAGVGTFVYVPYSYFFPLKKEQSIDDNNVDLAFRKFTKIDSMHIIHTEWDLTFTASGATFIGVELFNEFYGHDDDKVPSEMAPDEIASPASEDASDAAKLFWRELSDAVECLTAVADQYGSRTLADLMYLQNAILSGGFIDHYSEESGALELVKSLPSAERWQRYIKFEYLAKPAAVMA